MVFILNFFTCLLFLYIQTHSHYWTLSFIFFYLFCFIPEFKLRGLNSGMKLETWGSVWYVQCLLHNLRIFTWTWRYFVSHVESTFSLWCSASNFFKRFQPWVILLLSMSTRCVCSNVAPPNALCKDHVSQTSCGPLICTFCVSKHKII